MRPTAFMSPVCATPTTIVENSSGTMSPLMSAMNAREKNWKSWYANGCSFSGNAPPSTMPSASPTTMWSVLERHHAFGGGGDAAGGDVGGASELMNRGDASYIRD